MRPRCTACALQQHVGPADHVRVFLHAEELAGAVAPALHREAVPGQDRHVGDGVVVAGDVAAFRRGGGSARRAGASPPSRSGRWRIRSWSAHRRRNGRSRRPGTAPMPICQNSQDRHLGALARARSAGRRRISRRDRRGSRPIRRARTGGFSLRSSSAGIFEFGLMSTKPEPNWSPLPMSISQASYSAPLWPAASSSSSRIVTLTPFGVPSE